MKLKNANFSSREHRINYLAGYYKDFLKGRVLDVGCDQGILRLLIDDMEYVGIDSQGLPDIQLNLEEVECLPFEDQSFECVLCIDVLEHLDNLHLVFGELVRVAGQYLIISLPNCWCGARKPIERGRGSFAHYGLPAENPNDRHKWFFNISEAKKFVEAQAVKYGIRIADLHLTEKPRPTAVNVARRIRYWNAEHYANRYAQTLWVRFDLGQ
jgi:2-polyprenyl-3-methyl-5-hydroxy-6-metoxy-1,4-benzoquinol methylase